MLGQQYTEYFYTRTKNIDQGNNELFLFVGLTKKTYQTLGISTRKKVEPILSEVKEMSAADSPNKYNLIPEGTVIVEVTEKEFEGLVQTSKENVDRLFFYFLDASLS